MKFITNPLRTISLINFGFFKNQIIELKTNRNRPIFNSIK